MNTTTPAPARDPNERVKVGDAWVNYSDLTDEQKARIEPPSPPAPSDNDGDLTLVPRPTVTALVNEMHGAVEEGAVVNDAGEKEVGEPPLVHPATVPPEGPVNAEVPKTPVIAERVFERAHSGTEAAEAAEAARDPTREHPVDKATLTEDNGLKPTPETKRERKARTKKAARDATGHSSSR